MTGSACQAQCRDVKTTNGKNVPVSRRQGRVTNVMIRKTHPIDGALSVSALRLFPRRLELLHSPPRFGEPFTSVMCGTVGGSAYRAGAAAQFAAQRIALDRTCRKFGVDCRERVFALLQRGVDGARALNQSLLSRRLPLPPLERGPQLVLVRLGLGVERIQLHTRRGARRLDRGETVHDDCAVGRGRARGCRQGEQKREIQH
jgi:hypothetical protein